MLKYLLYQLEYRRWLLVAVTLAVLIHFLPPAPGLDPRGQTVLGIVLMMVLLVLFEPVPLPVIAFLIVVLEVLLGVAPSERVAQSFMSDSVIFIAGSLMLAVAVVKHNLDRRLLFLILRLTRTNILWVLFSILSFSALLASIMGEHAVAAIMLPVALVLLRLKEEEPAPPNMQAAFLLSIAFGCAVASVGTPSGGARNAIMINYLQEFSGRSVDYLQWTLLMYPPLLVQVPFLYFLITRFYPFPRRALTGAYARLRREMASHPRLEHQDWLVIAIIALTVLLWILLSADLGLGTISLIGVLLCIVSGVLNWEDINHQLNWGVIILYASVISLGSWMNETGAAEWIARGLHALLASLHIEGGLPLLLVVALVGILTGSLLSTGPAIAILGPIVLKEAELSNFDPLVLGLSVVAATSYANFSPLSSPACTIVYGSGLVSRGEYWKVGTRVALFSLLLVLLFAHFYWPWVLRRF